MKKRRIRRKRRKLKIPLPKPGTVQKPGYPVGHVHHVKIPNLPARSAWIGPEAFR